MKYSSFTALQCKIVKNVIFLSANVCQIGNNGIKRSGMNDSNIAVAFRACLFDCVEHSLKWLCYSHKHLSNLTPGYPMTEWNVLTPKVISLNFRANMWDCRAVGTKHVYARRLVLPNANKCITLIQSNGTTLIVFNQNAYNRCLQSWWILNEYSNKALCICIGGRSTSLFKISYFFEYSYNVQSTAIENVMNRFEKCDVVANLVDQCAIFFTHRIETY